MKSILSLYLAFSLLTLPSCLQDNREGAQTENQSEPPAKKETPEKMIEELVGQWERAGSGQNQTLTFTQEARYIMRKGNEKTDSGAYRMNEQLRNLYLESEADDNAREYEVRLSPDTLILSAKEDSQGEVDQIFVRRN